MQAKIRKKLARRKRRIQRWLDTSNRNGCAQPMLSARNIPYEIGERGRGISYGGIGAMHLLVRKLGLADAIDRRLRRLKIHLPYHESEHVLNLAYNALCDGTCLQDIKLRATTRCSLRKAGLWSRQRGPPLWSCCAVVIAFPTATPSCPPLIHLPALAARHVQRRQPTAIATARIDADQVPHVQDFQLRGVPQQGNLP